jgi:ferredoxin
MNQIACKQDLCDFCGTCVAVCPHDAIELKETEWLLIPDRCTACGHCVQVCPLAALEANDERKV